MLNDFRFRLRSLFRRTAVESEMDDELCFHMEKQAEKLGGFGLPEDEVRRRIRMEFGGQEQVREDCREARGTHVIDNVVQDLRYAARQLIKTPAFTVTVLLTLALGIGANAAIFTLVNAVLLEKLPVAEPKMLIKFGDRNDCCVNGGGRMRDDSYSLFSLDTYEQLKKSTPEFEELTAIQAGFLYRPVIARRDKSREPARSVMGEFVSGNYFRTFGLRAAAGRLFSDADDNAGAAMTAVMSYETWQRDYAGDSSVVGSTFWVNTKPMTIVGIAPEGFFGDRLASTPPDYYLPIGTMMALTNSPYIHDAGARWVYIVGRIKPGVALPALQQKVSAMLRQIYAPSEAFSGKDGQEALAKTHIVLTPGGAGISQMQEQYESNLHLLMWVSGLVLLIACANIANLLMVRGMGRKAEMSVRTALGAKRGRIVQQLLTESVLLAVLSGVAGLMVAYAGTRMLLQLAFPGAQNVPIHASPSLAVIGFAFGLAVVTGVLFGVAPAWLAAQAQPVDALRSTTRTTAAGASWLQRGLVILQAALSLVLLVGAGLFSQSLSKLQNVDMKLDARNRYIVHINPQGAGYTQTQLEELYRLMEERFHEIPGVVKVGISSYTPMEDNNNSWSVRVQGLTKTLDPSVVRANAEYFDSVGTRVVMGRGFGPQDTSTSAAVAVVNRSFVKAMFKPEENPVGHRMGFEAEASSGDFEIVGVVEDTSYSSVQWTDHAMCFLPLMRRPPSSKDPIETDDSLFAGAIVVETRGPMSDMEARARATLAAINPNLSVVKFQTFDAQIADRFTDERLVARLTMLFGGLALVLAAVGLYGVTSYTVARRTPEIGIRMALGAKRARVVGIVMRGALLQTAAGLAIGVPVAVLCVRFVKSQLYETTSANADVVLGAVVTLAVAACVAAVIPARRAASIDPVRALRAE